MGSSRSETFGTGPSLSPAIILEVLSSTQGRTERLRVAPNCCSHRATRTMRRMQSERSATSAKSSGPSACRRPCGSTPSPGLTPTSQTCLSGACRSALPACIRRSPATSASTGLTDNTRHRKTPHPEFGNRPVLLSGWNPCVLSGSNDRLVHPKRNAGRCFTVTSPFCGGLPLRGIIRQTRVAFQAVSASSCRPGPQSNGCRLQDRSYNNVLSTMGSFLILLQMTSGFCVLSLAFHIPVKGE